MALPPEFRSFASSREGVEAVIQRLGAGTYDLVLVDSEGNWTRAILPSEEAARRTCEELGLSVSTGWDDAVSQRVNELDTWSSPGATRRAL
jgi:hypothetical protein